MLLVEYDIHKIKSSPMKFIRLDNTFHRQVIIYLEEKEKKIILCLVINARVELHS